jgi:hypothetical protein
LSNSDATLGHRSLLLIIHAARSWHSQPGFCGGYRMINSLGKNLVVKLARHALGSAFVADLNQLIIG